MVCMAIATELGFTTEYLDSLPEDGNRYELIDGQLLVSPSPIWAHQEVTYALAFLLRDACPRNLRIVGAPFDLRPDRHNNVIPDVLVARYVELAPGGKPGKRLTDPPVLAVEVLSPSSKLTDRTLKKAFYERLGVRSYWLIDPNPDLPSLTAFLLNGSEYREIALVTGDEPFDATEPFPITVVPADLVCGLFP